jgi:hypothetical protein
MKYVLLATIAIVVQAAPPVPSETTGIGARQTDGGTENASNQANDHLRPALFVPKEGRELGAAGGNGGDQNDKATDPITIRELPPVTVNTKRDLADWGYWVFSAAIAVFAALQAWYLKLTLAAVRLQADAYVASQLPHFEIGCEGNPVPTLVAGQQPAIQARLFNRGKTVAHDCTTEMWGEICAVPFQSFSERALHQFGTNPITIHPEATLTNAVDIIIGPVLTAADIAGLQAEQRFLAFRIRVEYVDAFGCRRFQESAHGIGRIGLVSLPGYWKTGRVEKKTKWSRG